MNYNQNLGSERLRVYDSTQRARQKPASDKTRVPNLDVQYVLRILFACPEMHYDYVFFHHRRGQDHKVDT